MQGFGFRVYGTGFRAPGLNLVFFKAVSWIVSGPLSPSAFKTGLQDLWVLALSQAEITLLFPQTPCTLNPQSPPEPPDGVGGLKGRLSASEACERA